MFDHVIECFEGHVRIDRAAAVADECAEMVHFTGFARFQNEADFGAFALANQEMVETRNGEQSRHGGVIVIDATVAQNDQIHACIDVQARLTAKFLKGAFESFGPLAGVEQNRQSHRAEFALGDMLQLGEFFIGNDRRLQFDQVSTLGLRIEQVALRSDGGDRRGHDFLANAVNRRVGDLRKQLLEIVV